MKTEKEILARLRVLRKQIKERREYKLPYIVMLTQEQELVWVLS